jgi:hypothetical protein
MCQILKRNYIKYLTIVVLNLPAKYDTLKEAHHGAALRYVMGGILDIQFELFVNLKIARKGEKRILLELVK